MSGGGWRPHIETALALDVWRLHALGVLRNGESGGWGWTRDGEQVASVGYRVSLDGDRGTLTLCYTHTNRDDRREAVTCVIPLSAIPLNFGGKRWYGHCPCTGRRARKLYKFSGLAQFCHRTAIRPTPTYASQRMSGSDRIIAQRWALCRKMGDDFSDLFDGPCKPKWMRWRTFRKYVARDAELARREDGYMSGHVLRLLASIG
jgi:hypothetical protein